MLVILDTDLHQTKKNCSILSPVLRFTQITRKASIPRNHTTSQDAALRDKARAIFMIHLLSLKYARHRLPLQDSLQSPTTLLSISALLQAVKMLLHTPGRNGPLHHEFTIQATEKMKKVV